MNLPGDFAQSTQKSRQDPEILWPTLALPGNGRFMITFQQIDVPYKPDGPELSVNNTTGGPRHQLLASFWQLKKRIPQTSLTGRWQDSRLVRLAGRCGGYISDWTTYIAASGRLGAEQD
jgi:hypothetical protein